MQEDNNEIRNTSFRNEEILDCGDEIFHEGDEISGHGDEIFREGDEIYKSLELLDYKENFSYDTKVKTKSKTIGKITGIGLSSAGLLTFLVAVILSMVATNPFHPEVYEPTFKIDTILCRLEYSFEYKNPLGVKLYVDLENDNKESFNKTFVDVKNKFSGIFENIDMNIDYTFVVYQEQYNSKVYYYTKRLKDIR